MAVAKGYRDRHYPIDDLVIDWFHYTKVGRWTSIRKMAGLHSHEQAASRHELSHYAQCVARFNPEDRYYVTVLRNDWFEKLADDTPTNGLPYDRAGSDIDTTNPEAAKWYWGTVKGKLRDQWLRRLLSR
jgi:alpha-D-xyloside xylohydrolase